MLRLLGREETKTRFFFRFSPSSIVFTGLVKATSLKFVMAQLQSYVRAGYLNQVF